MTGNHELSPSELDLIRVVLRRHPGVEGALLFGSRAKGHAHQSSDVDLALEGVSDPMEAAAVMRELDDLPLPYRFDVKALDAVHHPPLIDHIARVGVRIFSREVPAGLSPNGK